MDEAVRNRIESMSRDFYGRHAASFAATRESPWDSWPDLWRLACEITDPRTVLDIGCGNGRFLAFLRSLEVADLAYCGTDVSPEMIAVARDRHSSAEFKVETAEQTIASGNVADVVVCFGVFHHIPGSTQRSNLLKSLARVTSPDGVAIVSFWQPKRMSNFSSLVSNEHGVDGLEENDFFLSWQGDRTFPRYCHHFDDGEIDELVASSGLQLVTQLQGRGNDRPNKYVILKP